MMRVNHPLWNARDIFFFWLAHAFHVLSWLRFVDSTPCIFSSPGPYWIITLEFYALSIKRHSKSLSGVVRGIPRHDVDRFNNVEKRGEELYCVCDGKPKIVFVDQIDSELLRRVGLETFGMITCGSICADQRIIFGRLWSFPLSKCGGTQCTHTRAHSRLSAKII